MLRPIQAAGRAGGRAGGRWRRALHSGIPLRAAAAPADTAAAPAGKPGRDGRDLSLRSLTGNIDVDGLHRYELDLLETVEWTKELLLKMRHDVPALQAMHVPYAPPTPSTPLCIEVAEAHSYDYTRPPPRNTKVTASFRVADLGLEARERHRLLLLAGPHYDPYLDVVRVTRETSAEEATEPEPDRAANKHAILSVLAALVREAKNAKGNVALDELPLPLAHVPPKRVDLVFPQAWIEQAANKRASTTGGASIPARSAHRGA